MNQTQLDGVTKAKLIANIGLSATGAPLHADDAAYIAHVCASAGLDTLPDSAADSYAAQYAGQTIEALELDLVVAVNAAADSYGGAGQPEAPVVTVAGVPQKVSFRQAKNQLQIVGIWDAAIAAAEAIEDRVTRIKMLGLLLDSTEYERQRPELIDFAKGQLGLTDAHLDGLFVAASQL